MRRLLTVTAITCSMAGSAGVAHSQEAQVATDAPTADVLFEYARSLVRDGRYAEACPKFEESLRLQPGIGTRFNLADCWEREGKLASAWAAFVKVAADTHALGQTEREQAARDRARSLEPRLGRLAIDVPDTLRERVSDLEVRCDGQAVSPTLWSVPMPLDAGKHAVDVRAGNQTRWSAVIVVEDGRVSRIAPQPGEGASLEVGKPGPADKSGSPDPAAVERKGGAETQRTVGWILVGGSAVVLGFGVLGLFERERAVSEYNDDPTCPPLDAPARPAPCADRVSTASTWKTASVVGFVGGGLLLGAGAVLLWTAPAQNSARAVACGPAGLGASCRLSF